MRKTNYIGKTHLASDIWEFRLQKPEAYQYIPGQYTAFTFVQPLADPRGQSRTMSLTSCPDDTYLAFATRVPEQPSPFKRRLAELDRGDELLIDTAIGDLILPRPIDTSLVFVAGGIGIASYISMLRHLEKTSDKRTVHLLYAVRTLEEKIFCDQIKRFPFASYEEYVSPDRLHAEAILQTPQDKSNTLYYLSGTEHFVEELRADLLTAGLSDTQIVFDYFNGYTGV